MKKMKWFYGAISLKTDMTLLTDVTRWLFNFISMIQAISDLCLLSTQRSQSAQSYNLYRLMPLTGLDS